MEETTHAYFAIAIGQAHEQNNALVKGDGGAVGLTESYSFAPLDSARTRNGKSDHRVPSQSRKENKEK